MGGKQMSKGCSHTAHDSPRGACRRPGIAAIGAIYSAPAGAPRECVPGSAISIVERCPCDSGACCVEQIGSRSPQLHRVLAGGHMPLFVRFIVSEQPTIRRHQTITKRIQRRDAMSRIQSQHRTWRRERPSLPAANRRRKGSRCWVRSSESWPSVAKESRPRDESRPSRLRRQSEC
jgi:hypothetical protein